MKLKRLWCALLVLALLSGVSIFNQKRYYDLSQELNLCLRDAVTSVRRGELVRGVQGMHAFRDKVEKYLPILNMTTNHHEVDELMIALARSISYLNEQRLEEFYVEADQVLTKIEHIYTSECIRWDNIL